jgi:hypothetical protein
MIKTKSVRLTSPKGTAVYPWINEPDRRFDSNGVYSVTLRLNASDKDTADFISKVKKVASDHYQAVVKDTGKKSIKKADLPIKMVADEEGNETGEVDIKFKLKSQGGSGDKTWKQRPAIFDSLGKPMAEKIGGGSILKIGTEISPFYSPTVGVGVTLRLKAVQVLELREYSSGGSAESWFSKEDGFVSENKPEEPSEEQTEDSEAEETANADF